MAVRQDNIFRLGIKELYSLRADPILLIMVAYVFTVAVYTVATGAKFEVEHSSVGIVDEDDSGLSRRLGSALLEPYFKRPVAIAARDVDPAMNSGRFEFVVEIPPKFELDARAGRRPTVQVYVDATAIMQAGIGASYIQSIIMSEALSYLGRNEGATAQPINVVLRTKFNPNHRSEWFNAIMAVINNTTLLAVILTGSALIREREHGTVEHLLVMPVMPAEIMVAKIWANGLVIAVSAILSLWFVAHLLIGSPIAGSMALFMAGTVLYQISVGALGILLATFVGTMGQFGLLVIPVLTILNLLSGGATPMESMPRWLQNAMQFAPTTQFITFAQAVLFRGAGFAMVWPQLAALAAITIAFFAVALMRFRKTLASFG